MATLVKTSFLSMLVASLALAGVLVNTTAAAATAATDDSETSENLAAKLDKLLNETQFGASIRALSQFVGLAIIVYVAVTQLTKVTSSGAGVMTAVPPILMACIIGGILMNVNLFISVFAWVMEATQRAVASLETLVE